ncbi:hypothetical protein QQG55_44385 [Brugia pahangi]
MNELVQKLRVRLSEELPKDLNTDFQLQRWIDAYEHDLEACVSKFEEYLETRRMLEWFRYNNSKNTENIDQHPLIRKYGRFLTQTKITRYLIKDVDNGLVFMEMPIENPEKFLKAVRVSDYLNVIFGFCEYFQNLVLENEKKTGRQSYAICIFDQKGYSFLSHMNPFGAINKLMLLFHFLFSKCIKLYWIHLWLDYYRVLLKRVIIVNSSAFLRPMRKIMAALLQNYLIASPLRKTCRTTYYHIYQLTLSQ